MDRVVLGACSRDSLPPCVSLAKTNQASLHSYLHLSSRGLLARSRKLLLAVIIIMFISSTSISIIRMLFQLKLIDALGPLPPDDASLLITWTAVSNCLERLNYVLSDVIVVWRYVAF